MQTLTQPTLLLKPFADSGDKNSLPSVNTDTSNPQRADLTNGFPQITGLLPSQGGLPPERKDFNALGYLTTTYDYFYQAGGVFTFDSTISSAIGGYPLNARLWYTNSSGQSMILRSTKQNNTSNFNNGVGIGTDWVVESFIGVGLPEGYVSNCITNIPQDINLELASDGTLTLKSGSILTAPSGTQLQTASDSTTTGSGSSTFKAMVFASRNNGALQAPVDITKIGSGSTIPADGSTYERFFNTTDSKIYRYTSGAWSEWQVTLPIAVVTITSGTISNIDIVFNGAGYIGTSIFVLSGITGLAPNGFNSDGTLASYSITTSALAFYNNTESNVTNSYIVRAQSGGLGKGFWTESETIASSGRTYVPSKNRVYTSSGNEQPCFSVCRYSTYNNVITDFEIMPVVRIAKQRDLDTKQDMETALNYNYISNCITGISQDINLTLASDGTLTLHSGSVLTKPDGVQYQTTSDTTLSTTQYSGSGTGYILCVASGSMQQVYKNVTSGSTLPVSGSSHDIFYNSTDGKIYWYTSSGWTEKNSSLPIAKVTVDNGTVISIDQVFNGAGYIGHHAFVLPGVSCLVPDGKNSDGTLKSISSTTTTLTFAEMRDPSYAANFYYPVMIGTGGNVQRSPFRVIGKHEDLIAASGVYQYVIEDNALYLYNTSTQLYDVKNRTPFVEYDYDDGTVYLFDVEQPIRLDDKASLVGNNTLFGDNNFKGSVEFENNVDLGYSATVDTPTIGDPGLTGRQVANLDCVQTFFANAIGTPRDVTILWGDGTGVGTPTEFQLSEDFTNFEQIGYVNADDNGNIKNVFIQSTYWLNYLLQNVGQNTVSLGGSCYGSVCAINGYSNTSNPSTTTNLVVGFENNMSYYIFGINRKLTTVEDPLA